MFERILIGTRIGLPLFFSFLSLFHYISVSAQPQKQEIKSFRAGLFGFHLGVGVPYADMAKRFGVNGEAGASFYMKLRNNWLLGVEGELLFGSGVKENTLALIEDRDGNIIGNNGNIATINVFQRGLKLPAFQAGKVLSITSESNKNEGLVLMIGAGAIRHQIFIQDISRSAPLLTKTNRVGFDRLTAGWFISESVGFFSLRPRGYENYMLRIEATQAFTRGLRFDFNEGKRDDRLRLDGLISVKLSWFIPRREKSAEEYYYY